MKRIAILLAALLGTVTAMTAYADRIDGPVVKCHPKVCSNHGSIPVELGKGSCKAHPASCK